MEIIWGRFVEKTGGQKSRATVPLKSPLSTNFFCVPQGLIPRRTTFKFKYLREFEPEFENVLGYELGAHMGSIHEKNQGPKISCYCTFKLNLCESPKRAASRDCEYYICPLSPGVDLKYTALSVLRTYDFHMLIVTCVWGLHHQ